MKKTMILAVLAFVLAASAQAAGLLDGKIFNGQVGDSAKPNAGQADNFVFKDGTFESTLCSQFGYKSGAYVASQKAGNEVDFIAHTASASGGKKSWQGAVKNGSLEGTVTTEENGKTDKGWFKGALKG